MNTKEYAKLLELQRIVSEQKLKIEQQEIKIENLTQALLHARKKIFGSSSEATKPIPGQESFFAEDELLVQELLNEQKKIIVPQHTRVARQIGVREEMIKGLPVEVVRCEIDPNETCHVCGNVSLKKIGSKVVRSEVIYEPAVLKVRQYVQDIYKCMLCGMPGSEYPKDVFVKAAVPKPVLSHSLASASTVAQVMYQKYMMGIPLNRQENDWYQLGFVLSRANMANWVIRCSEEWLKPIYDLIHKKLLECEILHSDETRIQCNKESGKKASSNSFMWVLRSGVQENCQAALFYYTRTRAGEHARHLLLGYEHYLITDAYAGYEKISGIKRALCWSHVRRYYAESIPLDNAGKEISGSKGAEGRAYCDLLFKIEKEISSLSPEEKLKKRQERSKPVLEAFWSWVEKTSALYTTNEKLTTALKYSKNQKKYLETFLEDGRIPISNNACENAIRPFATGRRAWLFADTPKGAKASAVVYTIVETAKANDLNVYRYLEYLLEKMPNTDFYNHPKLVEEYLPWSPNLPDCCRMNIQP